MCPHGAAKSVLAAAYFIKEAKERGLDVHVQSVGTEPDPAVSPVVAAHLRANGYDVPVAKPQLVSDEDLTGSDLVVSLGCDLAGRAVRGELRRWDAPEPIRRFRGDGRRHQAGGQAAGRGAGRGSRLGCHDTTVVPM